MMVIASIKTQQFGQGQENYEASLILRFCVTAQQTVRNNCPHMYGCTGP